jgi:hypothetical protein
VSDLLGPAIMVIMLVVVLPVVFLLGGGILFGLLGVLLHKTVETDHAGSELLDLNT